MTKLFCPIPGCSKSRFGVPNPHQIHVNAHLRNDHGITVTRANSALWRQRQNQSWQAQYTHLEAQRSRTAKQMKDDFELFANDPSLELSANTLGNGIECEMVALMNVVDDEDREIDQPSTSVGAQASDGWFGSTPDYDLSLRTIQYRAGLEDNDPSRNLSRILEHTAQRLQVQPTSQAVGLPGGNPDAFNADDVSVKGKDTPINEKDSVMGEKTSSVSEEYKSSTPEPIERSEMVSVPVSNGFKRQSLMVSM